MNARVSSETCFENVNITASVTRKLLGCLLRCSMFGFFCWSVELQILMFTPRSAGGAETVRGGGIIKGFSTYDLQTATSMTWFLLAMIAYPEKQRKCQEELERVIGRSRMPTLADQNNLPYIRATVRELFRWRPVLPLGESCSKVDGYQS